MPQMTPQQFARWLEKFPSRLAREAAMAEGRSLRRAKSVAQKLSSGTLKTRRLRLLKHPYAKGFIQREFRSMAFVGPPPRDPAIINDQTGRFRSSWTIVAPSSLLTSRAMISKLSNTAPYAVYVQGGGRSAMIFRPFVAKIMADVRPFRLQQQQHAIHRVLFGR